MMTQKIKQLAEKIFNLPSHSQKQLEKILADAFEGCYTREECKEYAIHKRSYPSESTTDFDEWLKQYRKQKC